MPEVNKGCAVAVMFVACGMSSPLRAQTDIERSRTDAGTASSSSVSVSGDSSFAPLFDVGQVIPQPAGPPPTPRHTGIKAMVKGLIIDFKYLPSRENLMWAGRYLKSMIKPFTMALIP